jgi:hypothetical protein
VTRWHLHVDHRDIRTVRPGAAEEVVGVSGLGHDLEARLLEDPRDPLPKQHIVLADDDTKGHSATVLLRLTPR